MTAHPLTARAARTLARGYLTALERGDLAAILALFAPAATVHSPLYGQLPATEFYPRLLTGTGRSRLALRGVTQHANLVSIWFRYHWTLPSGTVTDFECVDILELGHHGLITALRIFYDTAATRPAFERETGTSWQPPPPRLRRARPRTSPTSQPHTRRSGFPEALSRRWPAGQAASGWACSRVARRAFRC